MIDLDLLVEFVRYYPAQPATGFWRAVEIGAVLRIGIPEGRGLDLGCGDGILTDVLLRRGGARTLVGVDIDPREGLIAERFPFYERVHICSSDAIPEPAGSFDFVLSNSVLEHIPELDATIAEVSRVLRPGGRFIFTVPGPAFHENLASARGRADKREAYLARIDRRLGHVHYLSCESWAALCNRHQLRVETCEDYLTPEETRRWERLSALTGGALYRLFGQKLPPIGIQRRLGLRQLQHQWRMPGPLARLIGKAVAAHLPSGRALASGSGSCLLITGYRASRGASV